MSERSEFINGHRVGLRPMTSVSEEEPVSEFDAILFDAGGVLLLPSPELTGPIVERFGGTGDRDTLLQAHFAGAHAMDHARADGDVSDWPAYHRAYVRAAGVPAAAEDAASTAFAAEFGHYFWRTPVDGAAEVLSGLAERGVPIGIVSNAGGQVEGDLARLGICGLDTPGAARVVCVVDSHVVGVSKPDPGIFAGALTALGLPASPRIAYVGDTVFYDVRASAAAGLTPLLHDPYGLHQADPHPSGPHRRLGNLTELLLLV
jgi:putative hydrolase of the HAD superfamily